MERLVADSPQQEARAQTLTKAAESYLQDYSIPLVDGAMHDLTSARSVAATSEGGQRINAIRAEFDRFVGAERELAAARQQTSDAAAQRAVAAAVAGLAGSILLIVVFAWYLNRAIVAPVRRAAVMADRLASGDLAARIAERGVGEIGLLERSFNSMARSLERTARNSPRRAPGSSPPVITLGGGSSAICTMGRSSGWCRWHWTCGPRRRPYL